MASQLRLAIFVKNRFFILKSTMLLLCRRNHGFLNKLISILGLQVDAQPPFVVVDPYLQLPFQNYSLL